MTDALPFLDADAIRAAVPIDDMLDAVEAAYRDVAAGRDRSPIRSRVALDEGDLLLMPGVREGGAGSSVKLVTVMPGNTGRGLSGLSSAPTVSRCTLSTRRPAVAKNRFAALQRASAKYPATHRSIGISPELSVM